MDYKKRMIVVNGKDYARMEIITASAGIDKNQLTVQRVAKWLVDNRYL